MTVYILVGIKITRTYTEHYIYLNKRLRGVTTALPLLNILYKAMLATEYGQIVSRFKV